MSEKVRENPMMTSAPLNPKGILHHLYPSQKIDFDVFKRPSFSLEESNSSLKGKRHMSSRAYENVC